MWNHLGLGTASAHAVPAHFHGCHPKHVACVTVHGCDVNILFLIPGNTNNYLACFSLRKKKHLAIHALEQIVKQFPLPKSLKSSTWCLLWFLCLIAAV